MSDELFALIAFEDEIELQAFGERLHRKPKEPTFSPGFAALVEKAQKDSRLWGAIKVDEIYSDEVPHAEKFDSVVLKTEKIRPRKGLRFVFTLTGRDGNEVKVAVTEFQRMLGELVTELDNELPKVKGFTGWVRALELKANGKQLVASFEIDKPFLTGVVQLWEAIAAELDF